MSLANASVQYAAAIIPGKEKSRLVKRMHDVSFVGMFRSDLFDCMRSMSTLLPRKRGMTSASLPTSCTTKSRA